MNAEELVGTLFVVLLLTVGKKLWYRFIENKYPDVDWKKIDEE